jgi:hypothetical protein
MGRCRGLRCSNAIDWKNYLHDRTVTDVRWMLEKRLGAARWKSERVLGVEMGARLVPDAMVELNSRVLAIEVELTRKSVARYLAIFQRYLEWQGPKLEGVLYVVPDALQLAHFFGVVLPAVVAKKELWGIRRPDLSLFRFTSLPKLLERRVWWTTSTPASPSAGEL